MPGDEFVHITCPTRRNPRGRRCVSPSPWRQLEGRRNLDPLLRKAKVPPISPGQSSNIHVGDHALPQTTTSASFQKPYWGAALLIEWRFVAKESPQQCRRTTSGLRGKEST